MDMEDPKSIQRRFEAAVKVIRNVPEDGSYDMSDDMLVMFYSYYKQATEGPCNTLKPNLWDPLGKAKWDAWKALGNMPKEQAMTEYVEEIQLIIETLPVTDRMVELMDALDPFYEIVDDDDDDDDEDDVVSKAAPLSTGSSKKADVAKKAVDEESESNGGNREDYMEMEEKSKDSSTLPAERGHLQVFNRSEENSVSFLSDEAHSSLNTEEEEEELVYDGSDEEMHSDSVEKPATPGKGSGVPRVHLADLSAVVANVQQGGNREPQCGSQDGKPRGVPPPVPHPPALGTVRTDRISARSGRGHSCQGDGECRETGDKTDKRALNTQITVILSQLQDDMRDVTTLEHLTAAQAEISPLKTLHSQSPEKRLPWWPLNLSPVTAVLAVIWPFAVHLLVHFYLKRRKKS